MSNQSKLSDREKVEVFLALHQKTKTKSELAREYNVHRRSIDRAVDRVANDEKLYKMFTKRLDKETEIKDEKLCKVFTKILNTESITEDNNDSFNKQIDNWSYPFSVNGSCVYLDDVINDPYVVKDENGIKIVSENNNKHRYVKKEDDDYQEILEKIVFKDFAGLNEHIHDYLETDNFIINHSTKSIYYKASKFGFDNFKFDPVLYKFMYEVYDKHFFNDEIIENFLTECLEFSMNNDIKTFLNVVIDDHIDVITMDDNNIYFEFYTNDLPNIDEPIKINNFMQKGVNSQFPRITTYDGEKFNSIFTRDESRKAVASKLSNIIDFLYYGEYVLSEMLVNF